MHNLPPQRELLRAFNERDSTYDGVFFTGVKTTGIFCRPVCTAKKPKPENVEFFPTGKAALFAGYRPCLRCRPLDGAAKPSPLVARLLAAIEDNPSGRIRDADLAALGLDASTARRQFKKQFGMTFQAYHRARRMGGALQAVRSGATIIDSQLTAGFASGSGFREAFHRLFGAAPARRKDAAVLTAKWIDTPLGAMLGLADDAGLHVFDFVDRRGLERHLERLVKRFVVVPGQHAVLDQTATEIAEYYAGRRRTLTVPLAPIGTDFQRSVWERLRQIAPGSTRSYAEVARLLGQPAAVRAVARANGDNFRAIFVPCHRVIGSDGSLTGYGGGLARKQWLLDHEARTAGQATSAPG